MLALYLGKLPNPRMSISEDGTALKVTGLDKDTDPQVFQCNASNPHGSIFVNIPLYVLSKYIIYYTIL